MRIRRLCANRLQHRISHRSVIERSDNAPRAVDLEIARCPDDRSPHITGEDCVVSSQFADQAADILGMNNLAVRTALRQGVEVSARSIIVTQRFAEMT